MKNSKKKGGNQKTGEFSKHHVLKIQLNGLQLEITSRNEQYSLNELDALLNMLAGNKSQLVAVSSSGLPLNTHTLYERSKDLPKSCIHPVSSSRFPPVCENLSSESNGYRSEY